MCLLALLFAVGAAPAANAASHTGFRALPAVADSSTIIGERYLVYHTLGRRDVRVFDTKAWTLKVVPYPSGCSGHGGEASSTRVLLDCKQGSLEMDVRTGKARSLPAVPQALGGGTWTAVGRYWLKTGDRFMSRRTGQILTLPLTDGPADPRYDLNKRQLSAFRLCAPFHQPGVTDRLSQEVGGNALYQDGVGSLMFGRCGSDRPPRSISAGPADGPLSLRGGWVVWRELPTRSCTRLAYSWEVTGHSRRRWQIPSMDGHRCASGVDKTRFALIVELDWLDRIEGQSGTDTYTVPRLLVAHRPTR